MVTKCAVCGQTLTDASGRWSISHSDHGIWRYDPKRIWVCASCEEDSWEYLQTLCNYKRAPKNGVDYRKIAEGNLKILKRNQFNMLDELYHALRKEHVLMDALAFITDDYEYKKKLEEYPEKEVELADAIAERYVYDRDYDCNLSYWDNIKSLYDEITTADCEPDITKR